MTDILRKKYIISFALLTITLLSYLPPVASLLMKSLIIPSSGTIGYLPIRPLHVEGRYIKDDLGNIVYLRGMMGVAEFPDSEYGLWPSKADGSFINNVNWDKQVVIDNLDAIKSWGANTFRLHTVIEHWKNENKYPGYRQRIKDLITWAGERGLYFIFDFYSVVGTYKPGHQQDPLPWPPYTTRNDVMPNSDAFVDLWVSVANELKVYPNVIFELFNEPVGPKSEWFPVVQQLVSAIRATGAENLIIIQYNYDCFCNFDTGYHYGVEWIDDLRTNYPFDETNIVWSTHLYQCWGAFGMWSDGRNAYTYEDIKRAFQIENIYWVIETLNMPLFIGEFGVNYGKTGTEFQEELEALRNGLKIFHELGIHYTQMWWRPSGRWPLTEWGYNYPPNEAGQILREVLASAYP